MFVCDLFSVACLSVMRRDGEKNHMPVFKTRASKVNSWVILKVKL